MKTKFLGIFLLFLASLILSLFTSCGPAVLPATQTPTALAASTASPIAMLPEPTVCDGLCPSDSMTATAAMGLTFAAVPAGTTTCDGLCPSDSMTATAAMGLTFAAIPTNTPPPWATILPSAGDLGWGSVYGTIVDGVTGLPIEGATVTCEQFSDASPYLCNGVTTTNSDGAYIFNDVFFRETDRITLLVEAPGYAPLRFEQASFTPPDSQINLGLFPATPTP